MRKTRLRRTDELLREALAELILTRVGDPRIGFVSVTGVKISPELDVARVYVTVLGDSKARDAAMKGLQSAAPYLQSELNKRIRLRRIPRLRFHYDESLDRGFAIETALRKAKGAPADLSDEEREDVNDAAPDESDDARDDEEDDDAGESDDARDHEEDDDHPR
jgi:ribosome-binding factor A